ncbi:MAG: hypothetical protein PHR28_01620 [candidate division Zixibacteria bacterium]|nr:hypothetical protein [candidate division Zixibacteria bacterium]
MAEQGPWPKLRQDLVVSEQQSEGTTYYILKDPITFRYFRVREVEYFLVRQFDGATDYETIALRVRDKFNVDISVEDVQQFAAHIDSLYFFEGAKAEYEVSSGRYRGQRKKSFLSKILFLKLTAFNPERMLKSLLPPLRFLFSPWMVAVMIAIVVGGFALFSANIESFRFRIADIFSLGSIVLIMISLGVLILIHEMAHAFTCTYYGGQVREMGFLLLYFQPCFYSNLSDSWMFKKKSSRLAVLWAGLFFQMVLFALAVVGWRVTVVGTTVNTLFWLTVNVCLVTLLFNLNPLIKLDGYYLLSEMVNIPNLRRRAFDYIAGRIRRMIGLDADLSVASPRQRRIFWAYTLLAGLYSLFLIGYFVVLVYGFLTERYEGFGFVLFLVFLALIFSKLIGRTTTFLFSREVLKALFIKPRNLIAIVVILAGIIIVFFLIPFPRDVGGEVIVRPLAEYTIALPAGEARLELNLREGGRVHQFNTEHIQLSTGDLSVLQVTPLVREGDPVKKGDTLAAIVSNQVSSNLNAARAELDRLYGEVALAQSPPKPEEVATAQATVNAAQSSVEQLKKDIERNKSLFEKNLIAGQVLEQSQSDYDIAVSRLKEARSRLQLLKAPPKKEELSILQSRIATQEANIEYLTTQQAAQVITSPIDGEVVVLYRNNLLVKVASMVLVEVAVPVADAYLEYIEPEASVRMKVRTYPEDLFRGVVTHIARSADDGRASDNRARFAVYAAVGNQDKRLHDGMSGYAKISCGRVSLAGLAAERARNFIRVEFWSWW